jgi:hypothetical protein
MRHTTLATLLLAVAAGCTAPEDSGPPPLPAPKPALVRKWPQYISSVEPHGSWVQIRPTFSWPFGEPDTMLKAAWEEYHRPVYVRWQEGPEVKERWYPQPPAAR